MITQDFTKPIDSATVLQKIVLDKAQWVKAREAEFPLSQFKENIQKSDRSFYTVRNPIPLLRSRRRISGRCNICRPLQSKNLTEKESYWMRYFQ